MSDHDTMTTAHPPYYGGASNPYEAIKVIQSHNLGFCLGNVLKYVLRAGKKGSKADDLRKARSYIDFELAGMGEGVEAPSRSALKAKAREAREALERERKISAGLRAERDDMRSRFEAAVLEGLRSVEDRCADGFQQCHICTDEGCGDNTNPLVKTQAAIRERLEGAVVALGGEGTRDIVELAQRCLEGAQAQEQDLLGVWNMLPGGMDAKPHPGTVACALRSWVADRYGVDGYAETIKGLRSVNQQLNERLHAKAARDRERARDLGADVDGVLDPSRGGRSAGRGQGHE